MTPEQAVMISHGINLAIGFVDVLVVRGIKRAEAESIVQKLIKDGKQLTRKDINDIYSGIAQKAIDEARP